MKKSLKTVKIVVADDHTVVRYCLKYIIEKEKRWTLSGEASNGLELLELVKSVRPDIAIVDLEMPVLNGYEAIAELRRLYPSLKCIAFSGFLTDANRQRAVVAGALATVAKSDSMEDFYKAIERVERGETFYSQTISHIRETPPSDRSESKLTPREKQIIGLIAKGRSSTEIGALIGISKWTVDRHRANIRAKLKLRNVAGIVKYAIENGYHGESN